MELLKMRKPQEWLFSNFCKSEEGYQFLQDVVGHGDIGVDALVDEMHHRYVVDLGLLSHKEWLSLEPKIIKLCSAAV